MPQDNEWFIQVNFKNGAQNVVFEWFTYWEYAQKHPVREFVAYGVQSLDWYDSKITMLWKKKK